LAIQWKLQFARKAIPVGALKNSSCEFVLLYIACPNPVGGVSL